MRGSCEICIYHICFLNIREICPKFCARRQVESFDSTFPKKNTFTQDRSLRFASSASCSVQTSKRVWHRRFVAQDRNNSFHERIFLPVSHSLLSILQHTFICKHINLPHLPHPFCFSLEIPFEMFPRSKSQPWLSSWASLSRHAKSPPNGATSRKGHTNSQQP